MIIEQERLVGILKGVQTSIFRAKVAPQTLYHYTTAYGLQKIVESAALRMSHTAYLNDASEIAYSRNIALSTITEFAKENEIEGSIVARLIHHIEEREAVITTAITCFSDVENLLNQWRDYGGEQAYCLGFDGSRLLEESSTAVRLVPMIYNLDEQKQVLRSYLRQIIDAYRSVTFQLALAESTDEDQDATLVLIAWCIMTLSSFFKHEAFSVEREWRLVWEGHHHLTEWSFVPSIYGLTPYFLRKFDVSERLPLTSVMIGPCRHPDHASLAVRTLLNQAKYDVPVTKSFIPLRV